MGKKKNSPFQIKRPGAFTAYCKRLGYKGVTEECIRRGKRSKNPRIRKEAVWAYNARHVWNKKKRKRKRRK